VARIAREPLEVRVALYLREPAVALDIGSLQPLERAIHLTPVGVDLGNLIGGYVLVVLDELRELCVGLLLTPQSVPFISSIAMKGRPWCSAIS